jgi:hypothetical protein
MLLSRLMNGLERTLSLSVAVVLCLSLTLRTRAQGPGTIHYAESSALFRISGAGGGTPYPVPGAPLGCIRPTDRPYDDRLRYVFATRDPDNFHLWDEATGTSIQLTNFTGRPYYSSTGYSRTRWSNDRQDTFLSFWINDPQVGVTHVVRPRVTPATPNWGAAIVAAGANFVPFYETDLLEGGRLEIVATWPVAKEYSWAPDGGSIVYVDPIKLNGSTTLNRLMVHVVGTPMESDRVLFDPAVTGLNPIAGEPDISPTTGQLLFKAEPLRKGPQGIVCFDPLSRGWTMIGSNPTKVQKPS